MNFFAEVEKTLERAFRKFTERAFGTAQSDELLLVHRAILEQVESKIQTVHRGRRLFPYNHLEVRLVSPDAERRALFQMAFAADGRLENDVRECLLAAGCDLPRGFALEVETAEDGPKGFDIEYTIREVPPEAVAEVAPEVPPEAPAPTAALPKAVGRLVAVRGKTSLDTYTLEKSRTNIGRLPELTDTQQRIVRRNDVVFDEQADEASETVSRAHAHIRYDPSTGEYRICDDESEYGTRIFRDGRSVEVPSGNRRGERLRSGDEIYLGRACLRFEQ
jgi:hypothetical protein